MTVYVDDMFRYPMGEYKRGNRTYKMSHMVADSTAELIAFCKLIDLDPKWIQLKGSYKEHFDITMTKREEAFKAGAIGCSMSEMGYLIRNRRETGSLGNLEEIRNERREKFGESAVPEVQ